MSQVWQPPPVTVAAVFPTTAGSPPQNHGSSVMYEWAGHESSVPTVWSQLQHCHYENLSRQAARSRAQENQPLGSVDEADVQKDSS
ncbi:hypothetical protein Anapl_09033 [Anas platyrhynchos]|uniref:Uncharacterized protein n=1 Tax=Anas platyrhynchos TaxID=8839 RepID=R0L7J7_ANAPL|nr:hypothetical protein Anapl_09033 [Anas platyrhynchos]